MSNGNFLFKAVVCGFPFCILLLNEINRVKKLRDNERVNKSLFLGNFDRSTIKGKDGSRSINVLERESERGCEDAGIIENEKRRLGSVNSVSDDEVLNYYYGKAWGYTTDYEIDVSLKTGDLIFVKHDLDNCNVFKRMLLLINRHLQNNTTYDELGVIWKKNGISYVYIQNILNRKEKLLRYSYFLQQYKPSVVTLRRFLCEDETIRKQLEQHMSDYFRINQDTHYSVFLNIIYSIFRKLKQTKLKQTKRKQAAKLGQENHVSDNMASCQCNELICKQIHFNVEINNLINMLLYRSFNLFFYFSKYINEQHLLNTNNEKLMLLRKVQSTFIPQNEECFKNSSITESAKSNGLLTQNKEQRNNSFFLLREYLEFPFNSLTHFFFIPKDWEALQKEGIVYEPPEQHVLKEIENFLSVLIENEHTLLDILEYTNQLKSKEIAKGQNCSHSRFHDYKHDHNHIPANNYQLKVSSFFNRISTTFIDLFPVNVKKKRPLNSNHVFDIYKKTNLLPPFYYNPNYSSFSFFLCLNNLYTPLNAKMLSSEKFALSRLSNLFHVRQEESEKMQKYFYQFNKIPRS